MLLLTFLALIATPTELHVPYAPAPAIDGRLASGEWDDALAVEHRGVRVLLQHDGRDLYLALAGEEETLGSVCLLRAGEVEVLHASMALARAVYRPSEGGVWKLGSGFTWGMRESDFSETARALREAHLDTHGWLANTTPMGDATVREYRIRGVIGSGEPPRLRVGYMQGHASVGAWPHVEDDACDEPALVRGETPEQLIFHPSSWVGLLPGSARR